MSKINLDTSSSDIAAKTFGVEIFDLAPDDSPDGLKDTKNRRIDVPRSKRGVAVLFGMAMPNGEFAMTDAATFRAVLNKFLKQGNTSGVYSSTEIRKFIVKRARQLGLVDLLPDSWGIKMEEYYDEFLNIIGDTTTSDTNAGTGVTSSKGRAKEAKSGVALPDGSYPIPNKEYLRRAIKAIGRAKSYSRAKAHIIKRARALGATSMLPDKWITTEEIPDKEEMEPIKLPETFTSFLVLEGEVPHALILEQTEEEKVSGTLRVKMPFFVGESIANTPHIPRRVYFPTKILAETVAEGKKQISAGKQPLTVYARHAHALADDHLPIGAIVDLVQENRIGYVILEIEPTTLGKDAQILLQANPPKLNAVSLRSGPKRFELEEVTVNGELMYQTTKLLLDGVDFAPNSPAMATYGREILAAEASVTSIEKKKEVQPQVDGEITLEAVKAKPEIVEEIEKPLLKRLDQEIEKNKSLIAENATFKEQVSRNELNAFVTDMASKHPKKEDALKLFMEIAAKCKTKEEFSAQVLPYFVAAAADIKPTLQADTLEDRLKKFFVPSNSITIVEEEEKDEALVGEHVGPLEVPS